MLAKDLAIGCGLMVLSAAAAAHHSFAAFDTSKEVTLMGTVKSFEYTNPHSWLHLAVMQPDGTVAEWDIEAISPNILMRQGWKKSTLATGDTVTAVIHPLRNGNKGGNLIRVVLPDGRTLSGGAP